MSYKLKLDNSYRSFLFDDDGNFNVFNLARLFKCISDEKEICIDISFLDYKKQCSIINKFIFFIQIYSAIKGKNNELFYLICSNLDQKIIDVIYKKHYFIVDNETLIFDINDMSNIRNVNDPHYVKNVRGAILLSLIEDLISLKTFDEKSTLFDENSNILLHSASSFLHNEDNAKMMWDILISLEDEDRHKNAQLIKHKLISSIHEKNKLDKLLSSVIRKNTDDSDLTYIVDCLSKKLDFPKEIYIYENKLNLWFVDDQQSNGWFKLIRSIIPIYLVNIKPLNDKNEVNNLIYLYSSIQINEVPDIALVDLRLTCNDNQVEKYKPHDLSGFEVVDLLLNKWNGLSVMIFSASNKLWNMEKAIEKGAVAYWRKSDELTDVKIDSPILTGFDIYSQLISKLSISLLRVKYKYIFRLMDDIRLRAKSLNPNYQIIQIAIENYYHDVEQKTLWMCWSKVDETKVNDGLFLGVMEIFNEIENMLWDPSTKYLKLVPRKKVQFVKQNSDRKIINDTLDYMDKKYDIGGFGLSFQYENIKGIRNKLPNIHGSYSGKDIKHASIINIEMALLIVWSLLTEIQ